MPRCRPTSPGLFSEATGFHKLQSGSYLVFDRRGHTVYGVDAALTTATKIVQVGQESGRIIQPVAFAVSSDDRFVVADAPVGRERVQRFGVEGTRLGGFVLPGRMEARLQYGGMVLNGVASIEYEGESILLNQPERGALITEYTLEGVPHRNIGLLRATGHEGDPDLHRILNTGHSARQSAGRLLLRVPDRRAAVPQVRRPGHADVRACHSGHRARSLARFTADDDGPRGAALVRCRWCPPIVRTAAVDRAGGLWISFTLPFTYVYDADGEKTRVVQFYGAGIMAPTSLSFARDGHAAGHTRVLCVRPRRCPGRFGPALPRPPVTEPHRRHDLRLQRHRDQPGACYDPAHRYDAGTAGRG